MAPSPQFRKEPEFPVRFTKASFAVASNLTSHSVQSYFHILRALLSEHSLTNSLYEVRICFTWTHMKGTYENNILLLLIFRWVAHIEEKWFLIIRIILTAFDWNLYQLVYDTGYYNKELNKDSKHKRMRFYFSCLLREKEIDH